MRKVKRLPILNARRFALYSPKGEERDRKTEKNILRDNGWNFPNLLKNLNA